MGEGRAGMVVGVWVLFVLVAVFGAALNVTVVRGSRTIYIQAGRSITTTAQSAPEVQAGVKAGDWVKYDYTITSAPPGTALPQWIKIEFLSVEGTNANVRVTMHMSDGTEQNATMPVDVEAGGQAFGLSGFVIPANLTIGDTIFMTGFGNVTITGETTRTYAGASRTVVYASFSQYGTQLTYYWDKQTGVMVEAAMGSIGIAGTAKATETNMWEATPPPLWTQWWLWATLAVVIVALAGAVYLLKKRKPPTPTAPAPPTESTQQNTHHAQVVTSVYKQEHSPLTSNIIVASFSVDGWNSVSYFA